MGLQETARRKFAMVMTPWRCKMGFDGIPSPG
jgi:hypothetical protein